MKNIAWIFGVCLISTACKREFDEIPAPPKAAFYVPATIDAEVLTTVENRSVYADSYRWTWGDGTTSTEQAPSHAYTRLGTFRIRLEVVGKNGTDTVSHAVQVRVGLPPAAVMNAVVGRYRGRLYFESYDVNRPLTTWHRDTILRITSFDIRTLDLLGWQAQYGLAQAWHGHLPLRSNYTFDNGSPYPPPRNQVQFQFDRTNDSIYAIRNISGHTYSQTHTFYGVKVP